MENSEKTRVTIRMDLDRKQQAEEVAKGLGIDLTAAVNLFISQMIKENGLPFKPTNDPLAVNLDQALKDVENGDTTDYTLDGFIQHLRNSEN
ncbi:type II toxin-antitoxin system RelB/DinJ family antitoxin [Lactiplantibacillus daowaiensis]|uniref:Type II toxin-antitoxin system RelB/DinJ family antitoxin n=1 Tax=Lactiplantibacillus daowaiensis TaxID=2559918 RepID=A0ABW1S180_9LACO|nr:type II toxin-antitoxin system RelB/DinJ family antitoxin [Lactiplantibacillus daowaiensis]